MGEKKKKSKRKTVQDCQVEQTGEDNQVDDWQDKKEERQRRVV